MIRKLLIKVVAAASALVCSTALAVPMTYEATSSTGHSLWLPAIGLTALQFENGPDGHGDFLRYRDGTATLSGIVAQGDTQFMLDVRMWGLNKADQPRCDAAKFENGATNQDCLDHWFIFDTGLTGTLTEIGGLLREFAVTSKYKPDPQFGTNKANAKNDNLGFSSWISYKDAACDGGCTIYHGDINIDLVKVPEPDTIALFGLGVVALGFIRRRKSIG